MSNKEAAVTINNELKTNEIGSSNGICDNENSTITEQKSSIKKIQMKQNEHDSIKNEFSKTNVNQENKKLEEIDINKFKKKEENENKQI